ncbi:MAG TPA: zinc metalloprotease HtpX [Caulobacteraceae bacterium]|nr:zinc metalloprotease HtpX [Caulobacteraceae bacterium]
MRNHLRTYLLLAGLTALFMAVGAVIGGYAGMMVALAIAMAMNLFSYWNADRIVLGMYGAKCVDETDPDPLIRNFVADVHDLADKAGLPRPRVHVVAQDQPNAFATGRDPDHAAVCATIGLLQLLDQREVRAVMSHELAHVKNRDTLTMTITATLAGAISSLVNFAMFFGGDRERPGIFGALAMMIFAPLAALLVQMAISRGREYAADHDGAEICGDPGALASALEKIEAYARGTPNPEAERHPSTSHLFIINPLAGHAGDSLFSTHPATGNRVAALMELAQGRSIRPSSPTSRPAATAVPVTRRAGPWG